MSYFQSHGSKDELYNCCFRPNEFLFIVENLGYVAREA